MTWSSHRIIWRAWRTSSIGGELQAASSRWTGLGMGRHLTGQEAVAARQKYRPEERTMSCEAALGCNIFVRPAAPERERWDEGLPLFRRLEDYDLSVRCGRPGTIVWKRRGPLRPTARKTRTRVFWGVRTDSKFVLPLAERDHFLFRQVDHRILASDLAH